MFTLSSFIVNIMLSQDCNANGKGSRFTLLENDNRYSWIET